MLLAFVHCQYGRQMAAFYNVGTRETFNCISNICHQSNHTLCIIWAWSKSSVWLCTAYKGIIVYTIAYTRQTCISLALCSPAPQLIKRLTAYWRKLERLPVVEKIFCPKSSFHLASAVPHWLVLQMITLSQQYTIWLIS